MVKKLTSLLLSREKTSKVDIELATIKFGSSIFTMDLLQKLAHHIKQSNKRLEMFETVQCSIQDYVRFNT